jgi:hypothetical protein
MLNHKREKIQTNNLIPFFSETVLGMSKGDAGMSVARSPRLRWSHLS